VLSLAFFLFSGLGKFGFPDGTDITSTFLGAPRNSLPQDAFDVVTPLGSKDVFSRHLRPFGVRTKEFYIFHYYNVKDRQNIQIGVTSFLYKISRHFLRVGCGVRGRRIQMCYPNFQGSKGSCYGNQTWAKVNQNCTDFSSVQAIEKIFA